jgi:outer membrane protein OmpA-like peptidoglycan-associated protein
MKRNIFNGLVLCASFVLTFHAAAQGKKGEKTALFFKYTFEKFSSDEVEVSEPGQISLLKGIKASTSFPADVFYGSGEFGAGANMYGYALPVDPKTERFDGNDKNTFISTDDLKNGNKGYAGIVTYKPGKLQKEKSFITIPFSNGKSPKNMIKGKKYCIELSISLAEASKYATNNIGMMFVKDPLQYEVAEGEESGPINVEVDRIVYNYKNKVYNSYSGWDKVCGVYVAKGDEKGVVIGNFLFNEQTQAVVQKKIAINKQEIDASTGEYIEIPPVLAMAYYYVDNLRIKEVSDNEPCNCVKVDTSASQVEFSKVVITKEPVVSEKMSDNEKIAAQVIYYAFGDKKANEVGKACIEYVAEYLKANPSKKVIIYAHNDEVEDSLAAAYEDFRETLENLDEQRGDYIKTRLMEKYEISENQITIIAENAEKPNDAEMSEDESAEDRELKLAYDRRVVFELTDK